MIRSAHQTGYILLPVIVVITLVAAIALLMNTESALESNTAGSELDAQQAQYVADAGFNHALWLTQQHGCGPYGNLTDEPLGNDKYTTNLTTDLGSTTAFTISVDQDSWIRSDQPTVNKATDLKLHTRNEAAGIERPLLRYDLSPIAAKAPILSATAWFYITNAHAEGPIDIHLTSADWIETDATWDSMNANMDSAVLATIPAQSTVGIWISVNLTSQVQAWVNGQPNFGITLNSTVDGVHGQYNSRESANPPWLEVVVGASPSSPALLKVTGTLANGVTRDILRSDVTLVQHPASFVQWQHDATLGVDAYIWEFNPTTNYETDDETWVSQSTNNTSLSLFKFDIDKLLPGTRILNATLSLLHESGNNPNVPVSAHRIINPWNEADVTWRQRVSGTDWDTYGGDLDDRVVSTTLVGPTSNIRYEWDLTSLVQGWADNAYPNYGVALRTLQNGSIGERFYSSDETDETRRPRLSVTYACTCGETCVTPQGGGNLLMVVINPTTLVAEDQKAKDLFESWGYTVSVISESANQSSYDAAVAANDVVFTSETVNSGTVGTKLVNAPIGVVSQDGDYNPDLGLAPGASLKVGNAVDIVSTDHYITRPFAVGIHEIYTADMEQAIVSGSLTADQQTLAEIGGDGSLVVLDQGDAMEGGGTAAGRRVILPLGTRYRFDWDRLNANGRLLVQRALEWGIGADKVNAGNLLLVVADPASLSAQEDSKKLLIESWGYTVTLINDGDSQANFDTAAAANDVIYVSGSISGGALADKLTGSLTPIVNEFNGKLDNFGFSSSTGASVATDTFTLTNTAHFISQPFGGSAVTHFTTSLSMPVPSGTLAPDLQTVGETSGAVSALVTLDTGAQRWDGDPVPARRVHLPFGSAEISQLTDDGQTLMRRAIEWGAGATLPPTTKVLMVVSDPASPNQAAADRKALMESWGYTVTLIDDDDSQANFDAGIDAADVVYVGSGSSATNIGTKLDATTKGVVNEPTGLASTMGFASSWTVTSVDQLTIIDNTHSITLGLANPVTVFTSSMTTLALSGTFSPNLQNLAEASASPAIVVLESGAARHDVGTVPGRRAQLPFASAIGTDLTADGELIVQRAIEWAAGVASLPGPIAHWKLDDAVGPTAIDSVGGNDATLSGDQGWTTGVADGALEFDGSGDYATTDNNFTPPPVGTVLFWMKVPGSPGSHGRILGLHDTWEVRHVTTGTPDGIPYGLVFDLGVTGVNTEFVTTVTVDTPDRWYFVAATYDTNNDAYQVFLDGALHKSGSYPSSLTVPAAAPLSLGTRTGSSNYFTGTLDDVQIYDRILSASEIADFYAAGAPSASSYTETYEPWTASSADTWETVSLATFGVPANAVVEVAVINDSGGNQRWGGVRAVGSTIDRWIQLHEAEAGGIDMVTMHVQADASSQIQHYSDRTSDVSFVLLGYWTGANYNDALEPFTADAQGTWIAEDVGDDGVGPNQVIEILIVNTDTGAERLAGVRALGATYQRRFMLQEAESGGVDALSMMVTADASSNIEVYSANNSDIDFFILGTWDVPPGTYTGTGGAHGSVSAPTTWETIDLSGYGVPADSVAQFVLANENQGDENSMRVREVGSTINNRALLLHEAEEGGSDLGSMHANVDASSQVQWAAQQGSINGYFYPVGWWVLSP